MQYSLIRGGAAGALALSLVLAACGSSGDDTATTDASTAVSEAESSATTEAATATTEADTATTEAAAASTTAAGASSTAAAAGEGLAVELKEWSITIAGDVEGGANTFALSNTGENPHALSIVKGESYESLPKLENGAVDEAKLEAGALIGASEKVEKGATGTLSVTLEPGNYVFFCPIAFGPNSHAKAGQVLSVTVS